MLQRINCKLGR